MYESFKDEGDSSDLKWRLEDIYRAIVGGNRSAKLKASKQSVLDVASKFTSGENLLVGFVDSRRDRLAGGP